MSFSSSVLSLCAKIPRGRVATYGDIARALGSTAYRAVGQALHHNEHDFVHGNRTVPCHRVVCSDGRLGGFAHGLAAKKRLLKKEGVRVKDGRVNDFGRVLFRF